MASLAPPRRFGDVKSARVKEQEAEVKDGSVVGYKVNLKVTFVLDGHAT